MIITSGSTLPTMRIAEYKGLVHETAVVSADAVRDLFASFKNVIGGKVGNYEALAQKARERALGLAIRSATRMGATAIIDFRMDTDLAVKDKGGYFSVTVIGTAVTYTHG